MGLIADLCCFAMVQIIYNNNPEIPMSAHYKLSWFVSRVSSASPRPPYSQGTSQFLTLPLHLTMAHGYAFHSIRVPSTRCIHAHVQVSVSSSIYHSKHALLQNPRYHRTCSFHSIPGMFLAFQHPMKPFLTSVTTVIGRTNSRPPPSRITTTLIVARLSRFLTMITPLIPRNVHPVLERQSTSSSNTSKKGRVRKWFPLLTVLAGVSHFKS